MIRITMKHGSVLIYEDFFMTKDDGKTPEIPLYVDESQTAGYEIDIRAKHFNSTHIVLPLYPGVHSELIICMIPNLCTQRKPMLPTSCELRENSRSSCSFEAYLYSLRYLNPTLPTELLRLRAEDIWMQLSKEIQPAVMPPWLLLHQRVLLIAEEIFEKHASQSVPDAESSTSSSPAHTEKQWQRFLRSCIPVCADYDRAIPFDALHRQLHMEALQTNSAASNDKINSRRTALQALVNALPNEPEQLMPWNAWELLLQSSRGCFEILKLFLGEGMLYAWLSQSQESRTLVSKAEWKQMLKKEAERLYHMLQDSAILKREPPVSNEQLQASELPAKLQTMLQEVLKAYHKHQDGASLREDVCEFQRLLGLPIDGRLHDRDCRLLLEISEELNTPPI